MSAPATIEIKDEIATITMDDGKANAINPTMLEALNSCLDQAEKEAKALIITGREGRFSGGFDLKLMMSL
ncbi:MAG: enoyl-CoA hydratase-related protein, partial [Pseudomonadota bacterium]